MPAWLGPLIGAAGSLIGGLFGQNSADKARAQEMQIAKDNIALQKQFAQKGIQWKTADALKAGIHPLYAMGAQTHSFSPVSVGGYQGSPLAEGLADAGQNIGRAVEAGMTTNQRTAAYDKTVQALTLTRMGLENDLLASQIATIRQPGHPPGLPSAGPTSGVSALPLVTGDMASIGKGTSHQDLENEYGEAANLESAVRYVRDRVPEMLGLTSKKWLDVRTPWGNFSPF